MSAEPLPTAQCAYCDFRYDSHREQAGEFYCFAGTNSYKFQRTPDSGNIGRLIAEDHPELYGAFEAEWLRKKGHVAEPPTT